VQLFNFNITSAEICWKHR